MQTKRFILFSISLLLCGCGRQVVPSTSTTSSTRPSVTTGSVFPSSSVTPTTISIDPSSITPPSTSSDIPVTYPVTLDIFSTNDYHGRVSRTSSYPYEGGIARFSTYLKNRMAENIDGSIFVNAGDLWQDTYDSALNNGELLTKAMADINCEAMALGNHEFDWGQENIAHNKEIAETYNPNHRMDFLGANIYHYEGGEATTHASELCAQYKIIERCGIRIGLIGGIGVDQISSITSSNWTNLTFVDPVPVVRSISDTLREVGECEVILYLYHGSYDNCQPSLVSATSPVTGKPYVDAVFLGHTHQYESEELNGVPFTQSYQHGASLGHVQLVVEETGVHYTYKSSEGDRVSNGYGNGTNSIYQASEDEGVKAIVDSYLTPSFIETRDAVVGQVLHANGGKISKNVGGMLAYATSDYIDSIKSSHPEIGNVDVVINNGNRDTIYLGENGAITNEKIFNLIPFTNKTIIAKVKGSDIKNECVNYSNPYYLPGGASLSLDDNTYYTVACIDYLLLHKNASRNYNYFPSYASYESNPIYVIEKLPYAILMDYMASHHTYDLDIQSGAAFTGLS